MGVQNSEFAGIRWLNLKNMHSETIPPYACCMKAGFDVRGDGFGTVLVDGVATWEVTQCNGFMEAAQATYALFINGPDPIPPGATGAGTRDWPALTIHDAGEQHTDGLPENLAIGSGCGPKAGKWGVYRSGNAFTCMGHNAADFNSNRPKLPHTVWVEGTRVIQGSPLLSAATQSSAPNAVQAGKSFTIPGGGAAVDYSEYVQAVESGDDKYYKFLAGAARIWFTFHATVSSASLSRGDDITITIEHDQVGSTVDSLTAYGSREQNIEEDENGNDIHTAKENIAISGILRNVVKDDKLILKNGSSAAISLIQPSLNLFTIRQLHLDSPLNDAG